MVSLTVHVNQSRHLTLKLEWISWHGYTSALTHGTQKKQQPSLQYEHKAVSRRGSTCSKTEQLLQKQLHL